ncbi:MAG: DUF1570 domain-containing protein [Phycisphaerales bacterium]|nr:DUF1570 domain-containing protein [Phycisphaerales bacterium]
MTINRSILAIVLAALLFSPATVAHASEEAATDTRKAPEMPREVDGVSLPMEASGDDSIELAKKLLPRSFKRNRSSSHVMFTDSDWEAISQARTVLQRAWSEYRGFCRRVGIVVPRPDEKLVCIIFNEHHDFLEFAKKTEGEHAILEHASGYFSPRFDWICFFEPEHHDSADEAHGHLDEQQGVLDQEQRNTRLDTLDAATAERIKRNWTWRQKQIDTARSNMAQWSENRRTMITIHEAVHQFTHVCHTWPGKKLWPIWLHEGLATSFETIDAKSGFGPDQLCESQDLEFLNCLDQDRLIPLRDFIAFPHYGDQTPETLEVLYAQAYGLMTWLYEFRKPQLAQFLKRLAAPPAEDGEADPVVLFEEIFGDIERLEKRWYSLESGDWRAKQR